ncbi:type 1 glutamine amidotransferase [Haloferula luteola]|uniref:Type 1 glutamine amidotransferase n=1 Tax=Haloferula luteola TaxID=595692 RepID=A0A840VBS4_9BACT|nr:ThuA domain-containing protein [Haloferula luteola]MBB5351259.1 type 1 glutamine amidotransferase [Haloferula luteola]
MMTRLLVTLALASTPLLALPPDSIEPMGQSFEAQSPAGTLKVLLVGSGSSHDFPKFFLGTDAETLEAADKIDCAATPNLKEALELIEDADVLVFSGNHDQWGSKEWQKALNDFADSGKGLVFLHAATWSHPWEGYNDRFIGGRTPSHGYGEFEVSVKGGNNPVTEELPKRFKIKDENYRFELDPKAKVKICCENDPDQTEDKIPSVWIVKDKKAKIVCITLGHDADAHDNPSFRTLLTNAVNWVGGR